MQLMAGHAGGASPFRIEINLYNDDDDDSAIHSLHLDPIKPSETVRGRDRLGSNHKAVHCLMDGGMRTSRMVGTGGYV